MASGAIHAIIRGKNIVSVMARFPDQHACIAHLERVRFGNKPYCPLCGSTRVARKRENDVVGPGLQVFVQRPLRNRHAEDQDTLAEVVPGYRAQLVNAKKLLSSHQSARDLDMHQNSTWYLMQRIRAAMAADQGPLLRGEADETYVGGKPRKRNKRRSRKPAKRGRGKTAVIGAAERGGKVKAMVVGPESPVSDLTGRGILRFIQDSVDPVLTSDEYRAYEAVSPLMPHVTVRRPLQEGFWGLLKRAWYGGAAPPLRQAVQGRTLRVTAVCSRGGLYNRGRVRVVYEGGACLKAG